MNIQVIQSSNCDRLKFYKLKSFLLSGSVLEFESKGAIFLEKEQYELKKKAKKEITEKQAKVGEKRTKNKENFQIL